MKRLSLVFIVLGIALLSVGVASSQAPDGDPPHDHRPPPDDGRPRHPHAGHPDAAPPPPTSDDQALVVNTTIASDPAENAVVVNTLLGGENTVFDDTSAAFTNHLPDLTEDQLEQFEEGDELFEQIFAAADGLGPVFNANSCDSCHVEDGRGRAPDFIGESESGFLIRLARPAFNQNGSTVSDPIYGGQLQDLATEGVIPEGEIVIHYTEIEDIYADGSPYSLHQPIYSIRNLGYGDLASDITFSPRVANQMIGLGLLEAISEETILSFADPEDANGDGISGRPNYVWDARAQSLTVGRFGWKANQPNLIQQTAGAYNGDMGISTSLFAHQPCTASQTDCTAKSISGTPEVSDEHLSLVVFYASTLAVPAQRNSDDPIVQEGEQLFVEAQCSACHISEVTTGTHPTIPQLSNQTIRPFTDLLLHDMGDGLADGQTDFQASGSEWRTPPLWGIGLFETVNGHTYYLHDGRARNLEEAILWHGGEAQASRDYFVNLSTAEREALLAFLHSL